MAILELNDVCKTYSNNHVATVALQHINLKVKKGSFMAILGRSGSGKSTLLHICGLLDNPSGGQVVLDGVDTTKLTSDELASMRNRKLGFVFQTFFLSPGLTVQENVELPMVLGSITIVSVLNIVFFN